MVLLTNEPEEEDLSDHEPATDNENECDNESSAIVSKSQFSTDEDKTVQYVSKFWKDGVVYYVGLQVDVLDTVQRWSEAEVFDYPCIFSNSLYYENR